MIKSIHSKWYVGLLAGVALIATGCLSKTAEKASKEKPSDADVPSSVYSGTWKTGCVVKGGDSMAVTLVFSGTSLVQTYLEYMGDTTCDSAHLAYTSVRTGTMAIGDAVTGIAGAFNIDITLTSSKVTPTNGIGNYLLTAAPGSTSLCGLNWVDNQAFEVMGVTANHCANLLTVEVESAYYQIIKVDGSVLTLGEQDSGHTGFSAGDRPAILSTLLIFNKQ